MNSSAKYFLLVLLALQCLAAVSIFGIGSDDEYDESDYDNEDEEETPSVGQPNVTSPFLPITPLGVDHCVPLPPKRGVKWVMSEWNAERGWCDQTPRALIVLAMAGLPGITPAQVRQMELQLDVEITTMLLRNHSQPLHPTDLVLFVQALLAMGRNPRDFYGRDLVALLLNAPALNHPALLLGLCDARAANRYHAQLALNLVRGYITTKDVDYLALALKAYSCMKSLGLECNDNVIADAQKYLISLQLPNGSFGNLYTTSLVVQALATTNLKWDLKAALKFLDAQSVQSPNMVSTYLILMAENCGRFPFVKDIHPDNEIEPVVPKRDDGIFVQYSVRTTKVPDHYFTIAIKMPRNASFFDVMQTSQAHDNKFRFESYEDQNHHRNVYSISGVPNDAEGNQYWHLCLQRNVDHVSHADKIYTLLESPDKVRLLESDHFIYWFRDTPCEVKDQVSNLY